MVIYYLQAKEPLIIENQILRKGDFIRTASKKFKRFLSFHTANKYRQEIGLSKSLEIVTGWRKK